MTNPTEPTEFETVSPGEAFALLGNEIRIDIIRALGETPDDSLSFSALRSRVDVADSGQFNYHLKALVGSFIRRTDEDEYELTHAGRRVIGAIFSGTFTQRGAPRTFELNSDCAVCGSPLLAEYERERVTISCQTCDNRVTTFGFPPGAFENRTRSDLAQAFDARMRSFRSAVVGGICPNCAGRMHGSIIDDSEHFENEAVCIEHICERCHDRAWNRIGTYLVSHPAVVGFHHDHGIDLDETPFWELHWLRDEETMVLSHDPWQVRLDIELDGDCLHVMVEEDLSVSII
jgi:DNA-binding HxlR family transcriptional regulator